MRSKLDKAIDALDRLVMDAERVSKKFGVVVGTDSSERPSDYQEWVDLRNSIQQAKYILKK